MTPHSHVKNLPYQDYVGTHKLDYYCDWSPCSSRRFLNVPVRTHLAPPIPHRQKAVRMQAAVVLVDWQRTAPNASSGSRVL